MKVLVVLVLAAFTGCNASLLYADQPKTKLDELTDTFWDYVNVAKQTTDETVEKFQQTEFGQDLSARLEEGAKVASTYGEAFWTQVPKNVRETIEVYVIMMPYGLALTAERKMTTFKKKLDPIVDRMAPLAEKISSDLTLRAQQVKDTTAPYVEKLKEKLDPLAQDIKARFQTLYDSFVNTN
ncbi:apolipoprotein A-I-like [Notolabrus celidotus]|uniref:apolipoprotein A-I-like n=1 Tax=Notolabrus celidotus TaxID=1203425 RepID=UPI0014908994|nr:apolipoprotein A-I-like [Notolabrus celidotus]